MELTRAGSEDRGEPPGSLRGEHYKKVKEIIASHYRPRAHRLRHGHRLDDAHADDIYRLHPLVQRLRRSRWVVGQAHGKSKLADSTTRRSHRRARSVCEWRARDCGIWAMALPTAGSGELVRKCRIGAQGSEGFAEVLTGGAGAGHAQRPHLRPWQHGLTSTIWGRTYRKWRTGSTTKRRFTRATVKARTKTSKS